MHRRQFLSPAFLSIMVVLGAPFAAHPVHSAESAGNNGQPADDSGAASLEPCPTAPITQYADSDGGAKRRQIDEGGSATTGKLLHGEQVLVVPSAPLTGAALQVVDADEPVAQIGSSSVGRAAGERPFPSEFRHGSGGVYVELQADDPNVRIDRVVDGTSVPACLAPCRRVLDRKNHYVIEGYGLRSTSEFLLPDNQDRVTLTVKAGSLARFAAGAVLMGTGGAAGFLGLFSWRVGIAANENRDPNAGPGTSEVALIATGLSAAAIGAYLAFTTQTTVTSSTGSTFSETPPSQRKRPLLALTPRGIEF